MKRLAIVLCVAWGVALCCCSDDDPILDPESAQQVLQDCTHVGVFSMLRMVEAVDEIIEVISLGFGDESITATESEDPGDPDFTWNVRYDLSSTGSSNPDTRIAGKMTFSADPTDLDGIQDGDVIDLILTISTLGGPYTGSISAAVTVVDEDTSRVSGLFQLNDNAEGCNLEFDIPEVPGLAISDVGLFVDRRLAANVFGILIEGVVNLLVSAGGHTLDGTLTLDDQSQDATVTNATIDDLDIDDFSFQVAPEPATIIALSECLYGSLFTFQFVILAIEPVAEEIDSPGTHPEVTITEVGTGVYDFEIDNSGILVGIGFNGTLSGRVTFGASPTAPVSVTWEFEADGSSFTAQSTAPLTIVLPTGSTSGAGSLTATGEISCNASFDIPSARAVELVDDDGIEIGNSGRITFTSMVAGNTLRLVIDLSTEGEVTEATLNGIPIPPDLILGFL